MTFHLHAPTFLSGILERMALGRLGAVLLSSDMRHHRKNNATARSSGRHNRHKASIKTRNTLNGASSPTF